MAEAMTQVNVRMSAALKEAGDQAFLVAGLSPSEVIRAVYARAAELSHTLRAVSDIVTGDVSTNDEREEQRLRIEAFNRSAHTFADIAAQSGLEANIRDFSPMSEDEIEEAFYQDYLAGEAR